MLNPFAHEYTPASSFPPEEHTSAPRKNSQPKKQQPKKKKTDKPKPTVKPETSKPKKTDNTKPNETPKAKKNDNAKPNDASKTKRNDNASKKSSKEPQQTHNKARRKSSHHNTQMTPSAPLDQFEKESKFITIEAAIDPIRRIDTNNNATSSSSAVDKTLFEHGYEKYIDWIGRSLRMYDTVTLIGMDNAIIDIVSLVTILHDRKIGVHDDVETFSMDAEMNNRITACIQVKLHPFV